MFISARSLELDNLESYASLVIGPLAPALPSTQTKGDHLSRLRLSFWRGSRLTGPIPDKRKHVLIGSITIFFSSPEKLQILNALYVFPQWIKSNFPVLSLILFPVSYSKFQLDQELRVERREEVFIFFTTIMDVSRVFVRGLPPTINESDFRKHFSRGHITDIKIIPNRRLGFVGYATPEEARQAVKLFNKSFIRMSKISVELAKPVSDPSLVKTKHNSYNTTHPTAVSNKPVPEPANEQDSQANEKKRKRDVVDESNPKFQEYLNVMQHAKNSANLVHGMDVDGLTINTPTTVDQLKVDGSASDDEYEAVADRPAKRVSRQTDQTAASIPPQPPTAKETSTDTAPALATDDSPTQEMEVDASNEPAATTAPATDDEWMRNRTNRLLDLVDDDDISPELLAPSQPKRQEPQKLQTEPAAPLAQPSTEGDGESEPIPEPQVSNAKDTLQTIRESRRLFLRNIAYTATEDDLKAYLEPFGGIEEVRTSQLLFLSFLG